jgi:Ni,Fe-hydrogenase maturation factor
MKRVYIAIGNPLRGDDGVGRRVLERVRGSGRRMYLHQLTPEVAADLESVDQVIFIDADRSSRVAHMEDVGPLTASAVIQRARDLYAFKGEAVMCRVPAREFPVKQGLSKEAEVQSRVAAELVSAFANRKLTQ